MYVSKTAPSLTFEGTEALADLKQQGSDFKLLVYEPPSHLIAARASEGVYVVDIHLTKRCSRVPIGCACHLPSCGAKRAPNRGACR